MWLVREVVEKPVAESSPGKVVTDDADKCAANQGPALCVASARQLVSHAHEQVNVFQRLVSLFELSNALEKEGYGYFLILLKLVLKLFHHIVCSNFNHK